MQEQFTVWENEMSGKGELRYVFLFKSRVVITKMEGRPKEDELPIFKHVATIRVSRLNAHCYEKVPLQLDRYSVTESNENACVFVLKPNDVTQKWFYLKVFFASSLLHDVSVQARDESSAEFARAAWCKDVSDMKETLGTLWGKCFTVIICAHAHSYEDNDVQCFDCTHYFHIAAFFYALHTTATSKSKFSP